MVNIFGRGLDRMGYLLSKKQKFDEKSYYQVLFFGKQFGRPRFQRSSLFAWTVVHGKVQSDWGADQSPLDALHYSKDFGLSFGAMASAFRP